MSRSCILTKKGLQNSTVMVKTVVENTTKGEKTDEHE